MTVAIYTMTDLRTGVRTGLGYQGRMLARVGEMEQDGIMWHEALLDSLHMGGQVSTADIRAGGIHWPLHGYRVLDTQTGTRMEPYYRIEREE